MNLLGPNVATEFIDLTVDAEGLQALTDDPQMIMKIPETLRSGWYTAVVQMNGDAARAPRVYLDIGAGFNEEHAVALLPSYAGDTFEALFYMPSELHLLRLDPCNVRGKLVLTSFELHRLTALDVRWKMAKRAFALARKSRFEALRELPKTMREVGDRQFRQVTPSGLSTSGRDYDDWMANYDFVPERDTKSIRVALDTLAHKPLISVVMPVYNTPARLLDEAITSVRNQIYPHWELCIADDCSSQRQVRRVLRKWEKRDPRIRVVYREENGHISHATNSAFELANGEWIALLDHDDLLRENALAEIALELDRYPDSELIYSDEDKLDTNGLRFSPYFKPNFSRELFRSQNYLNHLTVHRADNIRAVGGWRPGFEGSQDYDLNLRIVERIATSAIRHIPKILYHWRAIEGSTATSGAEKSYAWQAGHRALVEHIERTGACATVEAASDDQFYRIRPEIGEPRPLVSLIIPIRDKVELLRGCVNSILQKTEYSPYEIVIVDNGSKETKTLDYLKELSKEQNIRVLRYDRPFNYSAINNFAVSRSSGSIVGLINNDIEVISPNWLTEMVSWAIQPDVGCVGAKLYYEDDTIQHAGVIVGLGGVAGHSHKHFPREHLGYFARLKLLQNLSAVTAACLLVRKSVYEEVHGLEEKNLAVAFNDVDLCLKVRKSGYVNVWTPYAELYHLESVTRGAEDDAEKLARFQGEINYMKETWELDRYVDPYYSMHLTKNHEDFALRTD